MNCFARLRRSKTSRALEGVGLPSSVDLFMATPDSSGPKTSSWFRVWVGILLVQHCDPRNHTKLHEQRRKPGTRNSKRSYAGFAGSGFANTPAISSFKPASEPLFRNL